MTEFWGKPAEKSGKVLTAFLEGLPLFNTSFSVFSLTSPSNNSIFPREPQSRAVNKTEGSFIFFDCNYYPTDL
jgi:hypothetical protein